MFRAEPQPPNVSGEHQPPQPPKSAFVVVTILTAKDFAVEGLRADSAGDSLAIIRCRGHADI